MLTRHELLRKPVTSQAVFVVVIGLIMAMLDTDEWKPVSLVAVLGAALILADVAAVRARRLRMSSGLMVQTTIMALLGPGPAVVLGVLSTLVDSAVNRIRPAVAVHNLALFSVLGLVGGLLFELIRGSFGLDRVDPVYALVVLPTYGLLSGLNLALLLASSPVVPRTERLLELRDSVLPAFPVEAINALLAAATVLVWAQAGVGAAAGLLFVVVSSIFLTRTVAQALRRGDDLVALREVSDKRAAEVARLASDRERLLSEVLRAEERERARLAELLHDGPMQRLVAIRQDAAARGEPSAALDSAIADTRAIISAFHPATVRELGFEASLRAAVLPFPAAQDVRLRVDSAIDDRALAKTLLLPIAQELLVNAVKHARPTTVDVLITTCDGRIVLEVNDDGEGIDADESGRAVQAGHVGLAMVRRRVEDAGGALEIATRTDGGTRSRVILPLARTAPT